MGVWFWEPPVKAYSKEDLLVGTRTMEEDRVGSKALGEEQAQLLLKMFPKTKNGEEIL